MAQSRNSHILTLYTLRRKRKHRIQLTADNEQWLVLVCTLAQRSIHQSKANTSCYVYAQLHIYIVRTCDQYDAYLFVSFINVALFLTYSITFDLISHIKIFSQQNKNVKVSLVLHLFCFC